MADMARIEKLIAPVIASHGLELVRVKMMGTEAGPTLQVMAEDPATGQLLIDQCAALSKEISLLLDEHDPVEGAYNLEVSSPGIDRPLARPKDFALWAGHKAKIVMKSPVEGRRKFQGRLAGLEGEAAKLVMQEGEAVLPLADIDSAKLVLTDELVAATQPQNLN